MGSPLPTVVANIFMESFESDALENSEPKPKAWFWYVDDTFIIWPCGRDTLDSFLGHLNSQHPDIKVTIEVERNGVIPFPDVLVTRKPNRRLGHLVYQKPTHTDRYLQADSHRHPAQKLSVVNSLVRRVVSISEPDSLSKELQHVKSSLQNNGQIRDAMEIRKQPGNINRENGYHLSAIWKPLLQVLPSSTQPTIQASGRARPT
ncbi:hypothetical protein Trydic_g4868 [Trypoxylus dichotomus]